MRDILFLMPIIIISIATILKDFKKITRMKIYLIIGIILMDAIIIFATYSFATNEVFQIIGLAIINLFCYALSQSKNTFSLTYNSIYLLSVIVLSWLLVIDKSTYFYLLHIMLYILAVNNQSYMRKSYEESMNEYQNNIISKQVQEVENIYLTMRGWRHDYHNHLQTLKAYLKLNQTAQAEKYLSDLEIDLDSIKQLVETGNVSVDAIINSKLSLALKNDIALNYKVTIPDVIPISDIDLCVIIGNLIDNAVEACQKIDDGEKFIRLYIGVYKKSFYISNTNSTNEVIRKLDDQYITNKRGNHGHGLKRINNIVDKYQGYINRKNEPGVFSTEIMFSI